MPFMSPPPSPVLGLIKQLLPLIVLIAAAPLLAAILRTGRRTKRRAAGLSQTTAPVDSKKKPISALQRAEQGTFAKKRLFNNSELKIFRLLEDEIGAASLPLRVMGQTSMRGFLDTDSRYEPGGSHFAIGEQRMDFVISDGDGNVVLAVEYNGPGHFQNNAEGRDARKSIALDKAGIPFLIIEAGEGDTLIRRRIRHTLDIAERS